MQVDKRISDKTNKKLAESIVNRLRIGDRCFGNPTEFYDQKIKDLETKIDEDNEKINSTDWKSEDKTIKSQISAYKKQNKLAATLSDYIERLLQDAPELDCIVSLACLEDIENDIYNDMILVSGNKIMILTPMDIKTSEDLPLYIDSENKVMLMSKELFEIDKKSILYWKDKLSLLDKQIVEQIVIINKENAYIWENKYMEVSPVKILHISRLKEFLIKWNDDYNPLNLEIVTNILMNQIRKERSGMDLSEAKRRFKI